MIGRLISLVIAAVYLIAAYFGSGGETAFRMGMFLILPLACIWFSEAMGAYTGVGFGRGGLTSTTPGCFVAFGGWLLLALPVIVGLIMWARGNN